MTVDENNFLHSFDNNPATFYLGIDNDVYYSHGFLHNINGPTVGGYFVDEYWIMGKKLSKKEWELEVNRLNFLKEI